ncbi:MAG: hypothetical protein WCF67_07505 [Chitinophagaceae bacterium]
MPLQTAKESKVSYSDKPGKQKEKKIHPRKKMPPVRKGKFIPDEDNSPPIELD